jgi:PPK2 family polyphosphate:nucleotide phosphotransferase
MNPRKQFRAAPDFKLKDHAPGAKPLSSDDKSIDKQRTAELAEQIAAYQDIFYAERRRKLLIILQGMDTSGKDGTVRGVFGSLDPLGVQCVAFKAPTQDEKEHDFLWRVHRVVPGQGQLVIFNRSHYEDVLVPAVHGNIDKEECKRRYSHIRDFERMLCETGTVLVKFFLNISKDEQKKRLEERLAQGEKHWKVDPNDLKERVFWGDYQQLYERAIAETDTDDAPWYIIPADSKTHRNLAIASILADVLKDMNLSYPPANPEYFKVKVE